MVLRFPTRSTQDTRLRSQSEVNQPTHIENRLSIGSKLLMLLRNGKAALQNKTNENLESTASKVSAGKRKRNDKNDAIERANSDPAKKRRSVGERRSALANISNNKRLSLSSNSAPNTTKTLQKFRLPQTYEGHAHQSHENAGAQLKENSTENIWPKANGSANTWRAGPGENNREYNISRSSSSSQLSNFSQLSQRDGASSSRILSPEPMSQPAFPKLSRTVSDGQLREDPCLQYKASCYEALRLNELKYRPNSQYLKKHHLITSRMRRILMDWIVEVNEEYEMSPQTLQLTVNYIDRFLSNWPVEKSKLQLVGVACHFAASKYEEIYPPTIDDFVYISDNTYSRHEVLRMERNVLTKLKFCLTVSTPHCFLKGYAYETGVGRKTFLTAQFFVESMLQEDIYLKYQASKFAAAGLYLARKICHPSRLPWPRTVEDYSGYTVEDIMPLAKAMHKILAKNNPRSKERQIKGMKLGAVADKYNNHRYMYVSNTTIPPWSVINSDYV